MQKSPRGFTLIELLVVVAIIAVLIAILLPALGRARDQAKTTACAAKMKSLGQAIRMFAQQNQDRLPGGGSSTNGSRSWHNVLNHTIFADRAQSTNFNIRAENAVVARTGKPGPRQLGCTNFINPAGTARSWAMNDRMTGGNGGGNAPANQPYGLYLAYPPNATDPVGRTAEAGDLPIEPGYVWSTYYLGAKILRFPAEANKIMVVEGERADLVNGTSTGTGAVVVPGNDGYPSWSTQGGVWAFRHNMLTRGNFLFLDAHVETLSKDDNVSGVLRYAIDR